MPDTAANPDARQPPARGPAERLLRKIAWVFFGSLGALILGVVLAIFFLRGPGLPPLTRAEFTAAQQRWRNYNMHTYHVDVSVRGSQPADYSVDVLNDEPTAASRNGIPIKQQRVWATWSVPGMFDTIQSDLDSLEQARPGLTARCLFDADHGYPVRYQRIDTVQGTEITWTVTRLIDIRP